MFIVLLFSCVEPESSIQCNGHEVLCDRRVSEAVFAATHNSMAAEEEEWLAPNHIYAIPTQLKDGIRALNIDTYWWEEEAHMCHGFCEIGAQPLSYATDAIREFLNDTPNTVLIITFQSNISAEQTLEPFVSSGLETELYTHTLGSPWPTLRTLIEKETRLLLFSNNDGGRIEGYMAQWEHWVDNPYSAQEISDFSCVPDRGNLETATLYNINHFLTNPIASPELAEDANTQTSFFSHIDRCIAETTRNPSQILVDFYSIGSLLDVVDTYNTK